MKVLLDSFHLNGHTLGFHPQTQKVQQHLLTQGLTQGVMKGLIVLNERVRLNEKEKFNHNFSAFQYILIYRATD